METSVLALVRKLLGNYTNDPRLHEADPASVTLQSLGIPSVEMIGIVIELEDTFNEPIDQSRLHELRTVADLVSALEATSGTPREA